MGVKNLVMLKTHIYSINTCFINDFVYGNMLRAFVFLRVFFCNYVFYSFGLILRYILRFQVGDLPDDQTERNQIEDSEIDGFTEELANLLFPNCEDVHEAGEQREGETESSIFMEIVPVVLEDSKSGEGETDGSVLMETDSGIHEDGKKREEERESSVFLETESGMHEDNKKREGETESYVFLETNSDVVEDGKKKGGVPEGSVFMETDTNVHEDVKNIDENETESSIFMQGDSSDHQEESKIEEEEEEEEEKEKETEGIEEEEEEEEEETEGHVFMESDSATTTSKCQFVQAKEDEETEGHVFMESDSTTATNKCQFVSAKDISGFIEEPTTMTFTFGKFYMGPNGSLVSDNAFANTENIADKEYSGLYSEEGLVVQEEEECVQERRTFTSNSTSGRFRFESDAFGGSDSSYDDNDDFFLFNDNPLPSDSDSDSESSSSSGLIWGNSSKFDDLITYRILASNNSCEGFESEKLKAFREEKVEDVDEGSDHEEDAYRDDLEKIEETRWEENSVESDFDEQDDDDDDFEWEDDDLVEQLKLEMRNARQGGLATILEEEDEDEETESPKVVEDLKPLKIEEKLDYKDQIVEIQKVYKSYEEKMQKLDILNYQTMHAIGFLQLKDPLKFISTPKSTVPGAKPLISQNLWPRKAPKKISDPLQKFVHELHRDLELVYVGQVCLSWEILCWQHMKAQELKQYDSLWSRRYNLVAGEFQLFQVLMQRFIENEPFQGPRIQNYINNRCVIRNLLQVPAIKDDSMKDKNIVRGGEEDAISSGRLAEIIKESMRLFWEFVRADKDYGNVILKVSQQIGTDLKDPAISDLLVDIRTQLQKKERKLKDIVRSGNCIVRRFQKHHEDQLDHEQLLAQVGLRLISRVMNMSKLRKDQLIWCHEKLSRIKFVSKKIQVESSFLHFPC